MNTPNTKLPLAAARRSALLSIAFIMGLLLNPLSAAPKSDDAAPAPVSVSFAKAADDTGPYIMTVANTASDEIMVKVSVLLSVQVHNQAKTREVPEKKLAAGESMTVEGLAATDKVTIDVKGYAPLEIIVPHGTM